jgi:hypothetical protein
MTGSKVVPDRAKNSNGQHRVEVRYGLSRMHDGGSVADGALLRPSIDVLRRELATWGAMT